MKQSFQRRIKRWILEELKRRLDQRNEIYSDRTHCRRPYRSGLPSAPAEGAIADHS
jgi:hypothetical protein